MHPSFLISAARSALRWRERQRRTQTYIRDKDQAERELLYLTSELEARIDARTAELQAAVQELALAQTKLRNSEELYRFTVELSSQTPWTADPAGRVIELGSRFEEISGIKADDLLLRGWVGLMHPDDRPAFLRDWARSRRTRKAYDGEHRLFGKGGQAHWYALRAAPRLEDGVVRLWYGTLENVDDKIRAKHHLNRLQEQLAEASRHTAMGALASALAHELNQPLATITLYARGLRRTLEALPDGAGRDVGEILTELDDCSIRAAEIIRRLRDLVDRGEVQKRRVSLDGLIQETIRISAGILKGSGIYCEHRRESGNATVLADTVQIQQVIGNLIRNAAEAIDGTGDPQIVVTSSLASKDFCRVSISDRGPGVPPAIVDHLFTPFASPKPQGTGIGLAICRTIVEAHGGQIWYEPNKPDGSIFAFELERN